AFPPLPEFCNHLRICTVQFPVYTRRQPVMYCPSRLNAPTCSNSMGADVTPQSKLFDTSAKLGVQDITSGIFGRLFRQFNASTGDGTYSVDSLSTIDIKALCGFSRFAKPAAVRSALIKLPTFSGNCACTPEKVILQTKTVIREYLLMRFITFFDICPLQSNLIPKRAFFAIF